MNRCGTMGFHSKLLAFGFAMIAAILATTASAALIVDDSWTDAGRTNGADPLDTNWWSSVSSTGTGIEVSAGSLGLVSGTSGRGIHAIFPTQTLANVGDSLVATYTFKTPATIGTAQSGGFRVGLFDTLGRSGLDADVTSSSASPNSLFGYFATSTVGLPGYMMDMDVGTGTEDISFRQLDTPVTASTPTGRLMGTVTGFSNIADGPNSVYTFAPNTTYTGSLTLTRINATDLQLTGTLGAASFTTTDTADSFSYGMLAFWANSNVFGSSATAGAADNGIDFSNVKIEFNAVPEPASVGIFAVASLLLMFRRAGRSRS